MTRALARLRQDEIVRMVKAVRQCGLPVAEVMFDGERVRVIVGDSGHKLAPPLDDTLDEDGPIREPQL